MNLLPKLLLQVVAYFELLFLLQQLDSLHWDATRRS
jgi:hypothetical protein